MAHVLKALVGESTTTTGTGALALLAAVTDEYGTHRRFNAVCSVSDTTEVMVRHATDGSWAHCRATYSAANELTLTETVESSTGSPISWAAGDKVVILTPLAKRLAFEDFTLPGSLTEQVYAISGTTPALNPANGTIQTWTLSANSTPTYTISAGQSMTLMIDDGTARTITWPTTTWVGGTAPTLATSGYTVIEIWKVGSTVYGTKVGEVA